jgi:hypothetical protein
MIGMAFAAAVVVTTIALALLTRPDRFDAAPAGPPSDFADDWETFERQFAEYVAARTGRRVD